MEHWYVLHTEPNAEYQVARSLTQRQIATYLPEMEPLKSDQARKPFFPCYLFVRLDLSLVSLSSVQWIAGLRRIVGFGGEPAPMPDEVIELIRHRLAEFQAARRGQIIDIKPGETVRITEGPLKDMLAIFDGPTKSAQRVQIMLTILGHTRRVKVQAETVVKAEARPELFLPKRERGTRGQGRKIKYSAG